MVAAVLILLWRQVPSVQELTRLLAREDLLWCHATKIAQQSLAERFLVFPAELFERVFKDLLPQFQENWHQRTQRLLLFKHPLRKTMLQFMFVLLLLFTVSGRAYAQPFTMAVVGDTQPFTMAVVGDTQFDWGCGSENTTLSDYCKDEANRKKSKSTQGTETNDYVIDRVTEVSKLSSNFQGLVINGDLTAFGSKDGKLNKFKEAYMNKEFSTWPGLGNHDYQNNINDCGSNGWSNWNYCGADMMQFLAGFLKDKNNAGKFTSYDVTRYEKNFGQAQGQGNVSGSLAYSRDIGDFHFVQLNNYPTYEKNFKRGYKSGISSWQMRATSPNTWIASDFKKAVNDNKKIILNWHDFYNIYGTQDKTNADYTTLISWLNPYVKNIKAIFVAHNHNLIGMDGSLKFPATADHQEISVPVISSGSPIWNRFIKADFESNGPSCTITIGQVNTMTPYTGSTTNPQTISCN